MAATFDPALPTNMDVIRSRIYDSELADPTAAGNVVNPVLQDETINGILSRYSFNESLAQCAEMVAVYFSRNPDKFKQQSVGGAEVTWQDRVKTLMDLAKRVRNEPEGLTARPRRSVSIGQMAHCDPTFRGD